MVVLPAFARPMMRTRNLIFGSWRWGSVVVPMGATEFENEEVVLSSGWTLIFCSWWSIFVGLAESLMGERIDTGLQVYSCAPLCFELRQITCPLCLLPSLFAPLSSHSFKYENKWYEFTMFATVPLLIPVADLACPKNDWAVVAVDISSTTPYN